MGHILELSIKQTDCPHPILTSKIKGLSIIVLNTIRNTDGTQTNFSIFHSSSVEKTRDAIRKLKNFPNVEVQEVIGSKGQLFSAIYKFPSTSAFHRLSLKGFRLYPIIARDGIEKWYFYLEKEDERSFSWVNDSTTTLVDGRRLSVSEFYDFYVQLFLGIWMDSQHNNLSELDGLILENAIKAGYFNWPRSLTLSDLSKKLSLPKTTLAYHLRKVEKVMFVRSLH
ncbi:MAG: helix-turn-helix domain-containing protein [Thermoplasmata archaeon]